MKNRPFYESASLGTSSIVPLHASNPDAVSSWGQSPEESIENNLHWQLDFSSNQDRIQCSDSNYLLNRVTPNKIALNTHKAAQKIFREKYGHD